jgi:hypothetical protein
MDGRHFDGRTFARHDRDRHSNNGFYDYGYQNDCLQYPYYNYRPYQWGCY